jgi:hypothetical protein
MTWLPYGQGSQLILQCKILFPLNVKSFCHDLTFSPLSPINRSKFAVFTSLTVKHLTRLQPNGWLNDELVNAGIKCVSSLHAATFLLLMTPRQWLLVANVRPGHSVHAMTTFFYGLWWSGICSFPPCVSIDFSEQHGWISSCHTVA